MNTYWIIRIETPDQDTEWYCGDSDDAVSTSNYQYDAMEHESEDAACNYVKYLLTKFHRYMNGKRLSVDRFFTT